MSSRKPPSGKPAAQNADHCLCHLSVTPKSGRNEILVQADGSILVRVTAPPADGAANQAVIKTLSDALSMPRSQIEIVRGMTSRRKQVRFEISCHELDRRLTFLRK